jgi:hypothetical protein
MATQTQTQRQAAAKKAAATRKRNASKRSTTATKSSARATGRSARETTRAAERTTRQATRATGKRLEAAAARLDAVGRQAERALLIQVGAAAELRDRITETAQTYTNLNLVTRELNRFERRGATVLNRSQRAARRRRRDLEHEVRGVKREVSRQAKRVA